MFQHEDLEQWGLFEKVSEHFNNYDAMDLKRILQSHERVMGFEPTISCLGSKRSIARNYNCVG